MTSCEVKLQRYNTDTGVTPISCQHPEIMDTSLYQLQVEVRPETEKHWLILIQVAINGEVKQLTSCVSESGISVTSDRAEADIVFHGRCDAFTAVFSVTTPEERLSVPLSVTVTPRYNINSPVIHKLDRGLADLVGREFLVHPKYALTCVHSYARDHNLYAGKNIICDETLQSIFGTVGVKLDSLWARMTKHIKRKELENITLSLELTDLNKTFKNIFSVKTDPKQNIYPIFYTLPKQVLPIKKTCSFREDRKTPRTKSFRRNKSVDL